MYVVAGCIFASTYFCFFIVHLDHMGHVPEEVVRFWVAELSCGLEYLHGQRIIHRYVFRPRYLKPD